MRTTDDLVKGIIETEVTISLTPFITIANELVTECCTGLDEEYNDARLILIETWLAAHFYTIRDPRVAAEGAGGINARYESVVDLGLNSSRYGQTAMQLDTNGGLAALNTSIEAGGKITAGITWLGTETEDIDDE